VSTVSTVNTASARFWSLVPAGLLAAMLAGLGAMATIAVRDPGFATEQNYYEKAVHYDREIAQRTENARLDWKLEASVAAAGPSSAIVLRIHERAGPVTGARVGLVALRNATSSLVLSTQLSESAPGEYRGSLPLVRGGLWELRVSAERGAERFTQVERRLVAEGAP
jgi:nitrogen fixation protein FixH